MCGIVLNEDANHFYASRSKTTPGIPEVDAWADQYAGTQVKELIMNINCMRTGYDSAVWESFWGGYEPSGPNDQPLFASLQPREREQARRWVHTAWRLHQEGIDVYARWLTRCRANGISPVLSVRMNDVHGADDESFYLHSSFWRSRPDLRRVPYRAAAWTDRSLDYGAREVREHYFRLLEEALERYDCDGLELDWMRFPYHFSPGLERAGAALLTEFMADVRRLLDVWEVRRGHRMRLSVRVPSRPETAWGLGMDAVEWARRGLIGQLAITPFWATVETDMPIEQWKLLLEGTGVTLAAGLELLIRAYPASPLRQTNSLETVRGAAAAFLERGADCIYLFNYMDSDTAIEDLANYPRLLQEAGSLATLRGKPRRHVVTYTDTWAPGEPQAYSLPLQVPVGGWGAVRMHWGPQVEAGQNVDIRIGLEADQQLQPQDCTVLVNGMACVWQGLAELEKPRPEGPVYAFRVPPEAVQAGWHVVELAAKRSMSVIWLEAAVWD